MYKILIHGGAWNPEDSGVRESEVAATLRSAESLAARFCKEMSALDMVEHAVALQEDEQALDAGIGSVVQLDGRIRMDSGICDSSGRYAAILQIEHVANPVKVARNLLEYGYHSVLSGEGAQRFAFEQGFESVSVYTHHALEDFMRGRARYPVLNYGVLAADSESCNAKKLSTVGAVAIDSRGNLAAACSTGGLEFGYPGRVGDTGIFGAGVYCSPHVAVACTGEGDKILRRLTARQVEDVFLRTGSLQESVDSAVADLLETENGYCGIIAISRDGETAIAKSTKFMSTASQSFS